jgi:hypothetical protein
MAFIRAFLSPLRVCNGASKKMSKRGAVGHVKAEVSLLRQCMKHDVWEVIERENLTMIDMLVLCWVSRDVRRFTRERMRCLGDFLFCALVACKACGSRVFCHCCGRKGVFHYSSCLVDVPIVKLFGASAYTETYRAASSPILSISLCAIDEKRRKATIVGVMKEEILYNWGSSHTVESNVFCLVVPLDKQESECVSTFYTDNDTFYLANGIYNVAICRKVEVVNDHFLFAHLS